MSGPEKENEAGAGKGNGKPEAQDKQLISVGGRRVQYVAAEKTTVPGKTSRPVLE